MPMKSIPKQHDRWERWDGGGQFSLLPALDWLTGVIGKDTIPDGDGRAGEGEEMELLPCCELARGRKFKFEFRR